MTLPKESAGPSTAPLNRPAEATRVVTGAEALPELCDELLYQARGERGMVVSDVGVSTCALGAETVSYIAQKLDVDDAVVLPEPNRGTLDWAREIFIRLHSNEPSLCVAVGGGAVLDAAKVAVSALDHPWLLDGAIWASSAGQLPLVRERNRGQENPTLAAVSTRPGTAAQIAPRAALSLSAGESQRLVYGPGLVPDYAAVDSRLWASLDKPSILEALCEMLFRAVGPYLVTQRCSERQDEFVSELVSNIVTVGWTVLNADDGLSTNTRAQIDCLSMESVDPKRTDGWTPKAHPWWCVQNTLAAALSVPKRTLTAAGLRAILVRERQSSDSLRSKYRSAFSAGNSMAGLPSRILEFLDAAEDYSHGPFHTLHPGTIAEVIDETFRLWGPVMTAGGWGDPGSVRDFLENDIGLKAE